MAETTQITVRIPSELVDWIDGEVAAGRAASRAAAISRIARRAQRRQQAEQDMARLLSSRPEPPDPDEESRMEWMRNRDWPDMGEPASVLYPERFQQNGDILQEQAIAWDHGYKAALTASNDEHRPPNPYVKTADALPSTAG